MGTTENSARDSESGEPIDATAGQSPQQESTLTSTAVSKGAANEKRMKVSTGKRVLTIILITAVIAIAIFGVSFTVVRASRREEKDISTDQDDSFDDYEPYNITDHGPFAIENSLFTSNVVEAYASIDELSDDIEALVKTIVNATIQKEAKGDSMYFFDSENAPFIEKNVAMASSADTMFQDVAAPSPESSSEIFKGVDDFETYQHEAGVVKNDLVKSNGAHVFAASGNRIKIWDLEGNLFETTEITSLGTDNKSINIVAMLLNPDGDKLTVIASDYGRNFYDDYGEDRPIIDFYRQTQVTTFKVEGSTIREISQAYIDGYHVESFSLGNNVHIVTRMMLNTWWYFDDNLWRYNFDGVLTDEEYVAEATQIAEEIIPGFVDKVIDLVTEGDEIILSRLVGFPNSSNDYKTISQVYSFDTSKATDVGIEFQASKSMVLTPGNTGNVYATNKWIWVADENSAWDIEKQTYVQQTMLLGFRLEGASSTFAALGTLPGQILSQFSIDFVEEDDNEYVRVATTQNFFQNVFWGPRPMPMPMPMPMPVQEESATEVEDILNETEESRTLNEVVIFKIPEVDGNSGKVNELVKLGSVEIGKIHETITAVRFFDNISYVVTFERTDPFYVLDLSDHTDPKILGELEVPGFSEFMHPIREDNSILLTVGKDADENGFVTGFQISIFDSTIPNDPKLVDRFVIENTSSSSSWDERAFRYIQVGDVGRLIIPLYSYSWDRVGNYENSFDGFTVFGIDLERTEMITREIDINHWLDTGRRCFCSFPGRSFVFDGNLMTMKGSSVISTDLVSEEIQWTLSLQDKECCY